MLGKGCLRGEEGPTQVPGARRPCPGVKPEANCQARRDRGDRSGPERLTGMGLGPCTRLHELLGQAGPRVRLLEADDESS